MARVTETFKTAYFNPLSLRQGRKPRASLAQHTQQVSVFKKPVVSTTRGQLCGAHVFLPNYESAFSLGGPSLRRLLFDGFRHPGICDGIAPTQLGQGVIPHMRAALRLSTSTRNNSQISHATQQPQVPS